MRKIEREGVGEAPGPAYDRHVLYGLLDIDPRVSEDPPVVRRHPGVQLVHKELNEVDQEPGRQEGREDHVEDAPFSPRPF